MIVVTVVHVCVEYVPRILCSFLSLRELNKKKATIHIIYTEFPKYQLKPPFANEAYKASFVVAITKEGGRSLIGQNMAHAVEEVACIAM